MKTALLLVALAIAAAADPAPPPPEGFEFMEFQYYAPDQPRAQPRAEPVAAVAHNPDVEEFDSIEWTLKTAHARRLTTGCPDGGYYGYGGYYGSAPGYGGYYGSAPGYGGYYGSGPGVGGYYGDGTV